MHKATKIIEYAYDKSCDAFIHDMELGKFNEQAFEIMSQSLDNMIDVKKLTKHKDIENTQIDDNIAKMDMHFRLYCDNKTNYALSHSNEDKNNAMEHLKDMLDNIGDIFEEIKVSSEFDHERNLVKNKIREIYQMF